MLSVLSDTYFMKQALAEAEKAYEQDQRRRADYQARFEKLNLGKHAELEAKNGWVRIRLDVLEVLLSHRPD